jgi:hypothetical protein
MINDKSIYFGENLELANLTVNTISVYNTVGSNHVIIDMAQPNNPLGIGIDDIGSSELELNVSIDTAFTAADPSVAVEWHLVSLPINPTVLTPGLSHKASVVTNGSGFAIPSHNMPLGAPFYIDSLSTTTGISDNVLYYAVPVDANAIKPATTLANAIAGTTLTMANTGTATVRTMPTMHLTTSRVPAVFLKQGLRITGRSFRQLPYVGGKLAAPYAGATPQPLGSAYISSLAKGGGGSSATGFAVRVPNRYLCLSTIVTGQSLSASNPGRFSAQLSLASPSSQVNYPVGMQAL